LLILTDRSHAVLGQMSGCAFYGKAPAGTSLSSLGELWELRNKEAENGPSAARR